MADNSATTGGHKQPPSKKGALKCGDVGTYREMKKRKTNKQERDHVPATSSVLAAAESQAESLSKAQKKCFKRFLKMDALTIAIPKGVHVKYSRTCKGRGGQARIDEDAKDLNAAADKDIKDLEDRVPPGCKEAYKKAAEQVKAQDPKEFMQKCKKKAIKEC